MNKQLRYIEISRRNRSTRIFIGQKSGCDRISSCGDVCIDIERAGKNNCTGCCKPSPCHGTCYTTQCSCRGCCEKKVASVCATEIDNEGYAIFHWGEELLSLKQGWYEGHVKAGCDSCGVIPLRVGPRCNVIEVETIISGPDNSCNVGCDDPCDSEVCPATTSTKNQTTMYVPDYDY